ncbi:hypothetical protein ABBQ32_003437 [Trebouxia sp. C0010 RCD-2024]
MYVAHKATIQPVVALGRGNVAYASTGQQGWKRQRLCVQTHAKSRRRSTQGVVIPEEPVQPEPPKSNGVKPAWVRELEEDAKQDDDIAAILKGTNGDPELIKQRMSASLAGKRKSIVSEATGELEQMGVQFREVDPFNLWMWFELYRPPSSKEAELLEEVLASWFMLGRLGAFNTQNLQAFYAASEDMSYMDYDAEECDTGMQATFHDMTQMELQDNWARCWINLGTADELALDMLINALATFSKENIGIKKLYIGGQNEDWEIPQVQLPKAKMDPMQGPVDLMDY